MILTGSVATIIVYNYIIYNYNYHYQLTWTLKTQHTRFTTVRTLRKNDKLIITLGIVLLLTRSTGDHPLEGPPAERHHDFLEEAVSL